ncbi:SDR family NAD(P)-dependent oxidoreductase [Subtercola boreus]|uniref:SDR family NAD(P)-dependent oxidoreductase n=1 Tax=Subtercola boreus TaxID=120213 RepID=UPI001167218B|nr:SDR family oxidoreductase [Subtercola boreus]TQL55972.1 NAD(P)-dependent dehydrogenase (short-subunit alcohol dehydrogenase family) [Subtercola boreus]
MSGDGSGLPEPKSLPDSGALVVGGSAGIGFASARKLGLAGVRRIVIVARNAARGEAARAELARTTGATVHFVQGDATSASEAARITDEAEQLLGGVDILVVSTVAENRPELFRDIPTASIGGILQQMLLPAMQMVSEVMPHMAERRGGVIITVASDAGKTATPGETIIGACKAAIIMFTRTIAIEGKRNGIRANVLTPSLVHGTASTARITEDGFSAKLFASAARAAHLGVPDADDLGDLVAFLAGPAARRLTGQAISVNGGISAA